MNLFWLTDIHLDHVNVGIENKLLNTIVKKATSKKGRTNIVITGDIANASCVIEKMLHWKSFLSDNNIGFNFVLGNHDYWGGSISNVRSLIQDSDLKYHWLPSVGVVELTRETALVGHDGWYDGGYANWFRSQFGMPDYHQIFELNYNQWWPKQLVFERINELAKEGAKHVFDTSVEAINNGYKTIYIATHVPPFRENSVWNDMISDEHAMPHFSSKHMGDTILELSSMFKDVKFIVLCGHSHGDAKHIVPPNLISYTSRAQYRNPCISRIIQINE